MTTRIAAAWRLLALLVLLLAVASVAPALPTASVAIAGDDEDGGDDDGNEGKGNDDDDDGKKDKDNRGKDKDQQAVEAADEYRVEVECAAAADGRTDCTFTPSSPDGGKEVNHVVIPEAVACAEVTGGDATFVEDDPHAHVAGYRFEGQGAFVVTFEGVVATGGSATYWVKAAEEVYPATGPGLTCDAAASADITSTPESTPPPATSAVVVATYACANVPAEKDGFDWFGACTPGTAGHRFIIAPAEGGDLIAAETDEGGEATFNELAPGVWDLDDADSRWCHAESDNVDASGQVVTVAGATTTVWLFYCSGGS